MKRTAEKDGGDGKGQGRARPSLTIGCGSRGGQSVFIQAASYFTVPPRAERGGYNTLYRGQASKQASRLVTGVYSVTLV